MNQVYIAKQMHRALQMLAQNLHLEDSKAMEIADLYEPWTVGKAYPAGHIVKFGVNGDGESQLYAVLQAHTSQGSWRPDRTPALYKAIGFADSGVAIWTQPLGAADAYRKGDVVEHKEKTWICIVDANVWEPGVAGWQEYDKEA